MPCPTIACRCGNSFDDSAPTPQMQGVKCKGQLRVDEESNQRLAF